MSAIVILLQHAPPDPLVEAGWHEQSIQQEIALIANRTRKPPRSWPILMVDNKRNPNGQS